MCENSYHRYPAKPLFDSPDRKSDFECCRSYRRIREWVDGPSNRRLSNRTRPYRVQDVPATARDRQDIVVGGSWCSTRRTESVVKWKRFRHFGQMFKRPKEASCIDSLSDGSTSGVVRTERFERISCCDHTRTRRFARICRFAESAASDFKMSTTTGMYVA